MPASQRGGVASGSRNSTWPGIGWPNTTWIAIRMTSTTRPSRRNAEYALAHGASERRAATT
jgi:hypothetical protein